MNNSILGRYAPYNTFVHKMDARIKFFCLIALMVPIFLTYPNYSMTFVMNGFVLIFTLCVLLISKGSILALLKSLKSLWFMVIFVLIIYILIPRTTDPSTLHEAFHINSFVVYWESILDAAKVVVRLVSMISIMMVFSATTKPLEMTDALEWYMTPLKVIGIPTHEMAMILSIALRFIPTILEDTQRVMNAQASRGVDFKHGNPATKVKAIISLIVPLFVSAFIRSEELADAMECRGYDPRAKRTKYRVSKFTWRDLVGFVVVGAIFALFITVSVLDFDIFSYFGMTVL